MENHQKSFFKRLAPFYKYLYNVKWTFLTGIIAGVLYGVSSGLGIPLMTKYIFPILFNQGEEIVSPVAGISTSLPSWLDGILSPLLSSLEKWYTVIETTPREQFLLIICAFLPLTFLLRAVGGYFNSYLINKAGLKVLEQIRAQVFHRLQQLSLGYYNKNKSGAIIMKLQGSSDQLRSAMMSTVNDLIIQPTTLIGAVGFIITLAITSDGALPALLGIIGIPLAVLPIRIFGKKIRKRAKLAQLKTETLSDFVLQNVQSPTEVRAYNLQQAHSAHFMEENKRVLSNLLKVQKYTGLISPAIEVMAVLGLTGAIYLGVQQGMTLETFTSLAAAIYLAYEPVKKLGKLNSTMQTGLVALDRLESILDATDELPENPAPLSLPSPIRGDLSFKNLSFSYEDSELILQGIDLSVKAGEIIALVGPSGSGKTTFMNLIPRLYDPSGGDLTLDGISLRDLSKHDLREQIAIVPQMPTLFNLTIRENIAIGKPTASLDEIKEAAQHAYAHDFISALPKGYDTLVSEAGTSLSGGQRQRVSIARAFLKAAPILLLDEATSALDNKSQEKITLALDKLMEGKTVFMIAHRESSLSSATRRLTFSEGRVVQDERV